MKYEDKQAQLSATKVTHEARWKTDSFTTYPEAVIDGRVQTWKDANQSWWIVKIKTYVGTEGDGDILTMDAQ